MPRYLAWSKKAVVPWTEPVGSFDTLVSIFQSTRRHIQVDGNLLYHRCETCISRLLRNVPMSRLYQTVYRCTKWVIQSCFCVKLSVQCFMFGMGRPIKGNIYRIIRDRMQHLHPRYTAVLEEHELPVSGCVCEGILWIDVGRRPLGGATRALH